MGGKSSKPKLFRGQPVPNKRIALFDLDGTLLFRTEVFGQWYLQSKRVDAGLATPDESAMLSIEKVRPRPDVMLTEHSEFVYIRPGALDALELAGTAIGKGNVHIFTASTNPQYVLEPTGIADKVSTVFTREWAELFFDQTGTYASRGSPVALKDFAAIRKTLALKPTDIVYLFDDHPAWIKNKTENDVVVSIPAFAPPYELYGVVKTHDIIPDTILQETILSDIVHATLSGNKS